MEAVETRRSSVEVRRRNVPGNDAGNVVKSKLSETPDKQHTVCFS